MKKIYIFLAVIIMFLALNCVFLGVAAADGAPLVIGRIPDSGDTVTAFFQTMKDGDYEKAMEYIGNYETLGFEKEGSELIELYKQKVSECYAVELIDDSSVQQPESSLEKIQRISLTYLDCRLLLEAVSEKTTETAMDFMNDGNVIENDEQAMEFVYEAFRECLKNPELYCTTENFDVYMKYDGESWKIELDENLAGAIFGYIESLAMEGIN